MLDESLVIAQRVWTITHVKLAKVDSKKPRMRI
jgi:hypothetical protein